MRALWVFIALSSVAGLSVASTPSEHVDVIESRCWDCHAAGLWQPAMQAAELHDLRFMAEGDQWFVEADLQNHWRDDLRNVAGVIHAGTNMGPVAREPVIQAFPVAFEPDARETFVILEYHVPEGATRLRFELDQDSTMPTPLRLEVLPAGGTRTVQTTFGADDLATAEAGKWLLQVSRTGPSAWSTATVTATASTDALLTRADDAGPGETTTLRWPITVTTGSTMAHVAVYYDTFYEHAPPTPPQEDTGHILVKQTFAMQVVDGTPSLSNQALDGAILDAEAPGIGLLAIIGALGALAWNKR